MGDSSIAAEWQTLSTDRNVECAEPGVAYSHQGLGSIVEIMHLSLRAKMTARGNKRETQCPARIPGLVGIGDWTDKIVAFLPA